MRRLAATAFIIPPTLLAYSYVTEHATALREPWRFVVGACSYVFTFFVLRVAFRIVDGRQP